MKIFISQKMRGETQEEIIKERETIEQKLDEAISQNSGYNALFTRFCDYGYPLHPYEFIKSYKPELAFKDPITSLSQSLAMLAEADIVLVPKVATFAVHSFNIENVEMSLIWGCIQTKKTICGYDNLRGCEFEFLIAKSYGKKVYTYDDEYNFEEVE